MPLAFAKVLYTIGYQQGDLKMKKTWTTPTLKEHGAVEAVTQQTKGLGFGDGIILVIPGLTPPEGIPVDDFGSL